MNSISRRLRNLEKNVVGDTPKTKTFLHIEDPTEREIHEKAAEIITRKREIAAELHDILKTKPKAEVSMHALDLTSDEKAIVDKSDALYRHRVMELFENGIAQYIHLNDPANKLIFYTRLSWFIAEMKEWLFLLWQEDQVFKGPEFFNLCVGEQKKLLKPIYSKWRKWLSEESWKKYYKRHISKLVNTLSEMTEEEIEADLKEVELENAEEEAKNQMFLREKCPFCTEKCGWYYEQGKDAKNNG